MADPDDYGEGHGPSGLDQPADPRDAKIAELQREKDALWADSNAGEKKIAELQAQRDAAREACEQHITDWHAALDHLDAIREALGRASGLPDQLPGMVAALLKDRDLVERAHDASTMENIRLLREQRDTFRDASEVLAESCGELRAKKTALEQELATLRGQWRDIETAPKDGTRILAADADHVFMTKWHICTTIHGDGTSEISYNDWQTGRPTHWMPLPKTPQTTEGEAKEGI